MRMVLILHFFLVLPSISWAHSGGLNASGCHNQKSTGTYHCHRAPASPSSPSANQSIVKMSKTRICHDKNSSYYSRTIHFTAFNTLGECLAAGGRLPK
jgi:hypothetical protein